MARVAKGVLVFLHLEEAFTVDSHIGRDSGADQRPLAVVGQAFFGPGEGQGSVAVQVLGIGQLGFKDHLGSFESNGFIVGQVVTDGVHQCHPAQGAGKGTVFSAAHGDSFCKCCT